MSAGFALDAERAWKWKLFRTLPADEVWAYSAAGSALDWQSRGQGFEPP